MRTVRSDIEATLRQRIRDGVYPPGARLPSHRDLQRELGVSSVTMQRACDRLAEQGFVEPRGALGTFVANRLPHRSTIAMVFADDPGRGSWNRFWGTIMRVAEEWDDGWSSFRIYHMSGQRADSAGHRQLCQDLADGGLAGAIFAHTPFFLAGSPALSGGFPRVSIGGGGDDSARYGLSLVGWSDDEVPGRIVQGFHAAGRRRFAAITAYQVVDEVRHAYAPLLRELGLETRPEWWQGQPIDPTGAACARNVARLLLSGPERGRPDCLLISDDNLVPHVTAGILDAGVEVPRTLDIAAHANYPGPTLAAVRCLRYGPDVEALVRAAVDEIAIRAGGGRPRRIGVPIAFRPA